MVGFGAKPTPTAHKKHGKTISSYRQNGQSPAKNPKPSFHFIFGTELWLGVQVLDVKEKFWLFYKHQVTLMRLPEHDKGNQYVNL